MAYTLTAGFNTGTAGQTLSAQLVDTAGTNVGSAGVGTFVDLGLGFYLWTYTAVPDGHRGAAKITSSGTLVALIPINPEELEYTDVKTSTRLAPGGSVTYTGPVSLNNTITIVRGDDYNNTDSRSLEWSTTDAATWPTLTGATITFTLENRAGTQELQVAGTVVTATGAAKEVRVELTSVQTAALAVGGNHFYDVQATISGRKVTLVRGNLNVLEDRT